VGESVLFVLVINDPLQSPVRFTAGPSFPLGEAKVIALPGGEVPDRVEGPSKIPASKRRADQAGESVFSISIIVSDVL